MQTPTHIVRKIGDHYEIVDKNSLDKLAGLALLAAGAGLALLGARRRGLKGLIYAAAGGYTLYLSAARTSLCCNTKSRTVDRASLQRGPSYPGERKQVHQKPADELQEASMESFPASDPPARQTSPN